ncbi:MAG: hypothetical protein H6704_10960 [Myxococcales bacterium]|nr:hypothetical protein [Myxococcales bacterium]MCB9536760.1 hypothetical protein [Myxococcales bacterium]
MRRRSTRARPALAVGALCAAALLSGVAPASAAPFWDHWSDGKAELNGYDLVQPRYGELRRGRAVLVYVTEPWSRSRRVKVDRFDPKDADQFTALKLNVVRKFQTGLYDYSVMTSVFVDPGADFAPVQVTFSGQEWCGHVFETLSYEKGGATLRTLSYFEGETTQVTLPDPAPLTEDALFVRARGLAADTLAREGGAVTLVGSALDRRLHHRPAEPFTTTLRWSDAPTSRAVPAGTFETHTLTYDRQGGGACRLHVEVPYPHRLIGWDCDDGEKAALRGTARLPYWQLHGEGQEKLLEQLGLTPPGYAP